MRDARTTRTSDCSLIATSPTEHGWTSQEALPFPVRRVYFMHEVAPDIIRGDHAHRALMQLLVAVRGSFDVHLNDGKVERTVHLNCPDKGLVVCAGVWKDVRAFTTDAVCLVLASALFTEEDYIRSWAEFLAFKQGGSFS